MDTQMNKNRFTVLKDGLTKDMPDKRICVCFTGHRSKSLKWGNNEQDSRCIELKHKLLHEIKRLYTEGYRCFISGMAEGVDIYAAEAVLQLQGELSEIGLLCVFPHGIYNTSRLRSIAYAADGVVSLNKEYVTGCMAERNRYLVNHSNHIVCVFSGDVKSGTYSTMCMAQKSGIGMTIINV